MSSIETTELPNPNDLSALVAWVGQVRDQLLSAKEGDDADRKSAREIRKALTVLWESEWGKNNAIEGNMFVQVLDSFSDYADSLAVDISTYWTQGDVQRVRNLIRANIDFGTVEARDVATFTEAESQMAELLATRKSSGGTGAKTRGNVVEVSDKDGKVVGSRSTHNGTANLAAYLFRLSGGTGKTSDAAKGAAESAAQGTPVEFGGYTATLKA